MFICFQPTRPNHRNYCKKSKSKNWKPICVRIAVSRQVGIMHSGLVGWHNIAVWFAQIFSFRNSSRFRTHRTKCNSSSFRFRFRYETSSPPGASPLQSRWRETLDILGLQSLIFLQFLQPCHANETKDGQGPHRSSHWRLFVFVYLLYFIYIYFFTFGYVC